MTGSISHSSQSEFATPPTIHLRTCLAVVEDGRLLMVPHYQTDAAPVQWNIPGGSIAFGESLQSAALREFTEETGLEAAITGLLDVSEVILLDKPWHSVTITFTGRITGGRLAAEAEHQFGQKKPCWIAAKEARQLEYHPKSTVEKALGIR